MPLEGQHGGQGHRHHNMLACSAGSPTEAVLLPFRSTELALAAEREAVSRLRQDKDALEQRMQQQVGPKKCMA